MADEKKATHTKTIGSRRVLSSFELKSSVINLRAYEFGRLLESMLDLHPDVDLSTVRLEENPFVFAGDKESGLELRIHAKGGKIDAPAQD